MGLGPQVALGLGSGAWQTAMNRHHSVNGEAVVAWGRRRQSVMPTLALEVSVLDAAGEEVFRAALPAVWPAAPEPHRLPDRPRVHRPARTSGCRPPGLQREVARH